MAFQYATVSDLRVFVPQQIVPNQKKPLLTELIQTLELAARSTKNDHVANSLYQTIDVLEYQNAPFAPKIEPKHLKIIKLFMEA